MAPRGPHTQRAEVSSKIVYAKLYTQIEKLCIGKAPDFILEVIKLDSFYLLLIACLSLTI